MVSPPRTTSTTRSTNKRTTNLSQSPYRSHRLPLSPLHTLNSQSRHLVATSTARKILSPKVRKDGIKSPDTGDSLEKKRSFCELEVDSATCQNNSTVSITGHKKEFTTCTVSNIAGDERIERRLYFSKTRKKFTSTFEYPTKFSPPGPEMIHEAYDEALRLGNSLLHNDENIAFSLPNTSSSHHQYKLKLTGSNFISFDEVIIPCVIKEQKEVLKKIQSKAQGHKAFDAIVKIMLCRVTLKAIERDATFAVKVCRDRRENERHGRRRKDEELSRRIKHERRRDRSVKRAKRDEERSKHQAEMYRLQKAEADRKQRERKMNFPKNMELWREVAMLMTDLARLEKEDAMWSNTGSILSRMENESQKKVNQMRNIVDVGSQVVGSIMTSTEVVMLHKKHQNVVNDITVSANRINIALRAVSSLIGKSDSIRKKLYRRYKNDHKFHGYLGISDPKSLVRALALD